MNVLLVTKDMKRPRYSKTELSQSLLVRLAFRDPRSLKPVGKPRARKRIKFKQTGHIKVHGTEKAG